MTVDFHAGAPVDGDLDVRWIHGGVADPPIQVHRFDPHTVILRQSKTVHYEGPFLYLFLGNQRALLLDTGATEDPVAFPLRETVDAVLDGWLAMHPRTDYELVVAHTHAHGDHVAGDPQFVGRPGTIVVGTDLDAVQGFFGFGSWPEETVRFDLGGRVLEIIGCPGHHETSIAVYDPWSGILVTGDTVYRGRLYAPDFAAFAASLSRLAAFAAVRDVRYVMGCHVEMRRDGSDYPLGARYQPDEPAPELSVEELLAIRDAAWSIVDRPGVHPAGPAIIYNGMTNWSTFRMLMRGRWHQLLGRRRRS
ncbi:hypothetical protein Val02_57910 [Virgisporangium aliadipatigenens]|uniref:Metallo-beta-lactamase domain-containing protein n=1 Tax=Virgisporangium aliadipatigenens TaxID=741659 RepID=A0A8J3YS70_9ACTN|nr:MBL fold metallo-hydrolase [Virgisporangium aliadipatigenens]GIJ48905.1 hypothetical protein Val02_57910 [Virgisporangium aliadipatigenens]